jgi:nucleotide-binding universal stress UspA family protein
MKTYLIPIDFSEAAFNAADFAASLSHQTDVQDIILMNAYYISAYETMLPDTNMMMIRDQEIEENAAERISGLEKLKRKLQKQVRAGVKIHIRLNRTHLVRAVVDTIYIDNVDLVIVGSKGNSSSTDTSIGSHVIKMSKASPAPLVIVPPAYRYQLIDRAVIACDFNKVTESIPLGTLHKLLGKQDIQLLVVNIDTANKHASDDPERVAEETALHTMLKGFHPRYYYVNKPDIINSILDFAEQHKAQIVIALPHEYSFLRSIVHNSVSQQLASSSSVPVLLLK